MKCTIVRPPAAVGNHVAARHPPLAPFDRDIPKIEVRGFAMRKECEASIKPGQAGLIVTYGNTSRKHCPLDGDLVVLGRASTCDISMVSPEVAPVHCILQRGRDGWRIRDCCGGRLATRLNGRPIHEEGLHDTDVLQIGTFSFEVRLPCSRPTPVPGSTPFVDDRVASRLRQLQRSRRNLVRLALRLRHRSRRASPLPPTLAELEREAQCLRDLQRDYEALVKQYESRLGELEKAEREVCDERAALESECAERQTRLEQTEHEMARHQAEVETHLKHRLEECQQRCRQAEETHAKLLEALSASSGGAAAASQDWALVLDRRSQELNYFARHLRRCRQQKCEQPVPGTHSSEGEPWREKYEQIRAEWTVREVQLQQRSVELQAEYAKGREEADALASKVKELQGIVESLTREIHDREAALQKYRRQLDQQASQANLEYSGSYERELNAYRQELEHDRQDLNEQIYQLQARQAEIESAAREAELQMSRERAILARERAELTRLRDEIRITRERTARQGGVRERLAQLHSLKQKITGLSPSAPGDKPRTNAEIVTADHSEHSAPGAVDCTAKAAP